VPLLPGRRARGLGLPLVGGALALGGWFAKTMRDAGTSIDVREPVTALVTDGPFRYSRNPAYVSLTLLYVGVAARRDALWPMLLLPGVLVVIRRGVVDREERYLERRFGEEYLGYKARVRRWL
jgi:protein-S-isoprenylcysteine O-methyltransferase Ste14